MELGFSDMYSYSYYETDVETQDSAAVAAKTGESESNDQSSVHATQTERDTSLILPDAAAFQSLPNATQKERENTLISLDAVADQSSANAIQKERESSLISPDAAAVKNLPRATQKEREKPLISLAAAACPSSANATQKERENTLISPDAVADQSSENAIQKERENTLISLDTAACQSSANATQRERDTTSLISPDAAATAASARRRRDNLHKRYKEATKKSQEIFARFNVSLLSTINDDSRQASPILSESHSQFQQAATTAKRVPLVLVPLTATGSDYGLPSSKTDPNLVSPDPEQIAFASVKAESTPILILSHSASPDDTTAAVGQQKSSIDGKFFENSRNRAHSNIKSPPPLIKDERPPTKISDRKASVPEKEKSRHYPRTTRGSFSSARDGYYDEYDKRRDAAEGSRRVDRRRPGSRASEYGGSRGYRSYHDYHGYGGRRSRPHSTYDFADDSNDADQASDSVDSEEEEDYEMYNYRRHRFYHGGSLRSTRDYSGNTIADPAWQKYLYEFYCHHGYYPTYEQLHQMWTDQQATLNYSSSSISKQQHQQQQQRGGSLLTTAGPQELKTVPVPGTTFAKKHRAATTASVMNTSTEAEAMFRTEAYVANQQRRLYNDEKASQLSVSVSGAGSDRSFDIPSSNISGADAFNLDVPLKHSVGHSVCRFGMGGQLTVVKGSGRSGGHRENVVELCHVRNLIKSGYDSHFDALMEKYEAFPGPLSPDSSDKNVLIQYCLRQTDLYRKDVRIMDSESAVLIWNVLVVLIRQNGNVTGPDLSRLLMEGCVSYGSSNVTEVESQIFPYKRLAPPPTVGDHQQTSDEEGVAFDRTLVNTTTQTVDRVEQHFRELLLAGSKKEALEWAIKHKLWGHALFLAMKIDQRTHTNVMIRFANSLPLTDPLQTLYQMLSGVTPSAVTRLSDDQWSDWRQHLSMMISNLSLFNGVPTNPTAFERELTSVLMLGNTLMDHGRTYAAQFCYLCCHILGQWDVFTRQNGRNYVSLIGAHSETKEDDVFSLDRYQMTELYEYAAGLAHFATTKQQMFLPTLQIYKLRYGLQLLELGYADQAYRYFKTLGAAIMMAPCFFSPMLINTVLDYGARLSRTGLELDLDSSSNFDPMTSSSCDQFFLPPWIVELSNTIKAEMSQASTASSHPVAEIPEAETASHQSRKQSTEAEEAFHHNYKQQQQQHERHFYIGLKKEEKISTPMHASALRTDETATNRRDSLPQAQLNGDVIVGHSAMVQQAVDHCPSATQHSDHGLVHQVHGAQQKVQVEAAFLESNRSRQASLTAAEPFTTVVESSSPQRHQAMAMGSRDAADFLTTNSNQPLPPQQQQQTLVHQQQQQQHRQSLIGYENNENYDYYNQASPENMQALIPNGPGSLDHTTNRQPQPAVDYYERMTTMQNSTTPVPYAAKSFMNNSKASAFGSPASDGSNDSVFTPTPPAGLGVSPGNVSSSKVTSGQQQQQKMDSNSKLDANKRNKSWLGEKLGGVVKKFLPKDSNEMILPDDRTKTIVWDESTGKWVNKDGDSPDDVAPPPPPSIAQDINSHYQQQQPVQQQCNGHPETFGGGQLLLPQQPFNVAKSPQPTAKPVNRFGGHSKRYVSVNAFGVSENSLSPNSLGAPSPPTMMMAADGYGTNFSGGGIPAKTAYFVPQPVVDGSADDPTNAANSTADPFSVSAVTAGTGTAGAGNANF